MEEQEKKYNLKNDIIFKAFFSKKGNEEFLIDFLNALLGIEIIKIEIREEVNLEQLAVSEKGGRLDLQAILNDGVIVNIELQIENQYNIKERTSLYAAKILSRNIPRGIDYEDMNKVIMINILGYNMFEHEDYISKSAIVLDKHREYEIMDNVKWYFIELPKFRKYNPDMNEKINQWLAFIDDENKEMVKVAEEKNKTLKKARKEIDYLTGDAALRRLAELREKWEFEYKVSMSNAKKMGMERGIKQGMQEGLEKGIQEGKTEGEKAANLKTAKKLLEMNLPINQIIEATGLSKEEIENLKNEK